MCDYQYTCYITLGYGTDYDIQSRCNLQKGAENRGALAGYGLASQDACSGNCSDCIYSCYSILTL